jgi:hypothetical protein
MTARVGIVFMTLVTVVIVGLSATVMGLVLAPERPRWEQLVPPVNSDDCSNHSAVGARARRIAERSNCHGLPCDNIQKSG